MKISLKRASMAAEVKLYEHTSGRKNNLQKEWHRKPPNL
jgi:hypothetical protein